MWDSPRLFPKTQIAQAIQDATGIEPPPLLHDPLLDYMRGVAARSEQALLQSKQHAPRVVVLASSDMLLGGLRGMLTAAGGAVRVGSSDTATLRRADGTARRAAGGRHRRVRRRARSGA